MYKYPFQSKILGGFHLISIHDQQGKQIFKEKSQKAQTFRPWFIANCNEAIENVEVIAETFENEIVDSTDMEIEFNDSKFATHLRIYPMMDSKLIDLGTGLGGAYCSCCKASEEEGLTLSNILQGRK